MKMIILVAVLIWWTSDCLNGQFLPSQTNDTPYPASRSNPYAHGGSLMALVAQQATAIAKAATEQAKHFESMRQRYGDHHEPGCPYHSMPPAQPNAMNYPASMPNAKSIGYGTNNGQYVAGSNQNSANGRIIPSFPFQSMPSARLGSMNYSGAQLSMPNAKLIGYGNNNGQYIAKSNQNSVNGRTIPAIRENTVNTVLKEKTAPPASGYTSPSYAVVPAARGFMGYFQKGISKAQNYFGQKISHVQNQIQSIRPGNNVENGFDKNAPENGPPLPLKAIININTSYKTTKPVPKTNTNVQDVIIEHISSDQSSNGENDSVAENYQSKLHGEDMSTSENNAKIDAEYNAGSTAEHNSKKHDENHTATNSFENNSGSVESLNPVSSEKTTTDDYAQTVSSTTPDLVAEVDNAEHNVESNVVEQAQQQAENIAADYVEPENTAEDHADQHVDIQMENMPEELTEQPTDNTAEEHVVQHVDNQLENMPEEHTEQPTENTAEELDDQHHNHTEIPSEVEIKQETAKMHEDLHTEKIPEVQIKQATVNTGKVQEDFHVGNHTENIPDVQVKQATEDTLNVHEDLHVGNHTENIPDVQVKQATENTLNVHEDLHVGNHTENIPEALVKHASENTAKVQEDLHAGNHTENLKEIQTNQAPEIIAEDHHDQKTLKDVKIDAEGMNSGNGTSADSVKIGNNISNEVVSNTTESGSIDGQSTGVDMEPEDVDSTTQNQVETIKPQYETAQNTTAKSCQLLKNVPINGKMMDLFFATVTCYQESLLQERITSAIITGARQSSVPFIVNHIENFLSMAYCTTQKAFDFALSAIKVQKAQNPQAAKEFKAILSKIHKTSKLGKQRLDYFIYIWKNLMGKTFGTRKGSAKKAIAAAAPILTANAQIIGTKMARMMFREFQNLGDAVYEASTKIASINAIKGSPATARCPPNARC